MRVVNGINPEFADFDEIDSDALDALDEFNNGNITLDELRQLIGKEAASAHAQLRYDEPSSLFDNPEDY